MDPRETGSCTSSKGSSQINGQSADIADGAKKTGLQHVE